MSWGVSNKLKRILGLIDEPMLWGESQEAGHGQEAEYNEENEQAMREFTSNMVYETEERTNNGIRMSLDIDRIKGYVADSIVAKDDAIRDIKKNVPFAGQARKLEELNANNPVSRLHATIDMAKQSTEGRKIQAKLNSIAPKFTSQSEINVAKAFKVYDKLLSETTPEKARQMQEQLRGSAGTR